MLNVKKIAVFSDWKFRLTNRPLKHKFFMSMVLNGSKVVYRVEEWEYPPQWLMPSYHCRLSLSIDRSSMSTQTFNTDSLSQRAACLCLWGVFVKNDGRWQTLLTVNKILLPFQMKVYAKTWHHPQHPTHLLWRTLPTSKGRVVETRKGRHVQTQPCKLFFQTTPWMEGPGGSRQLGCGLDFHYAHFWSPFDF